MISWYFYNIVVYFEMIKKNLIVSLVWIVLFWCVFWQNFEDYDVDYVPWEVIVKYKDIKKSEMRLRKDSLLVSSLSLESDFDNLEVKEQLDNSENIVLMEITDDQSVEDVIESLQWNWNIEYAEPNYIRHLFYMDNFDSSDPGKSNQWWLDSISWADGYNAYSWRLQFGLVKVWIIDNWVNYNHSDLKNSMWSWSCVLNGDVIECEHWYDFFHDTTTPLPNEDTHWTHVAWIIAAWINNWIWIIWVNPHAKIVALKVWRSKQFTTADEIKAINFAIDNWIKILNASYWSKASSSLEKDAIKRFWEAGWLFVTAAGNEYKKDLDAWYNVYPCKYDLDNIICVAAIDKNRKLASYSNYWVKSVDIAAPGSDIYSTIVKWNAMKSIYSWNFEWCKTVGSTIQWRTDGSCFKWSSDYWWWYQFTWSVTSPSFNLSGKNDVYLSVSVACASKTWVNVDMHYSTGDWNFVDVEHLWLVGTTWIRYTFKVSSNYYVENFLFKLNAIENSELFDDICVLDDVEVYEDPYVMNDNDRYWEVSWTSMATPHVAWLASLVRAINPKLSYKQVKEYIMSYWDDNTDCAGKTVSWKIINVKKTLDAVVDNLVSKPESLMSSRTWFIQWEPSVDAVKYYYEVLSGESVELSWFTENMWIETYLFGDYKWRVQAVDELWNKSKFVESFICEKPELTDIVFSWFECSKQKLDLWVDDNCIDMYNFVWNNSEMWLELQVNGVGSLSGRLYIENWFWERTNEVLVNYTSENSSPTMDVSNYTYPTTITSAWEIVVWDVVSLFWVKDGVCWSGSIVVNSVSCGEGTASLNANILKVKAPSSKQWYSQCTIEFQDDEWFAITWAFNYSFNTITKPTWSAGGWGGVGWSNWWWSNWWGGWGWWWGGWWGSTTYSCKKLPANANVNNSKTPKADTNYSYSTNISKVCTFQCNTGYTWNSTNTKCEKLEVQVHSAANKWKDSELQKPTMIELFEEDEKKSDFDFSRYNTSNPNNLMSNGYTVEFNNAYTFAHKAWITTTNSIQQANMTWKLTRIAMAKMLSNYAINVLDKKPANKVVPNFPDVPKKMNEDYGWAVDLAYQLWIMWVWIDNFRPNDAVTRWEFATALSRMLYETVDWTPYYSTHLAKLSKEWIITNSDPKINELRWYVMIMLMRSAKNCDK